MAATKLFCHLLIAFICLFSIQIYVAESRTLKSEAHSFKALLQSLKKVEKGQTAVGLSEVKKYLKKYGYYPYYTNLTNDFDDLLESALKKYQSYYGLKVTGKLESDTIKQLTIPRCGLPDIITNITSSESWLSEIDPNYAFPPKMPKWSRFKLTYKFKSGVDSPYEQDLMDAVAIAFQSWETVSDRFTFTLVSNVEEADIQVGFFRGDHGDGVPFDGSGGILAHSFYPEDGRSHFDADEKWSNNPNHQQFDLESVAVHEIGHLLGLAHSQDPTAVMYPTIGHGVIKRVIVTDDVLGLKALYT